MWRIGCGELTALTESREERARSNSHAVLHRTVGSRPAETLAGAPAQSSRLDIMTQRASSRHHHTQEAADRAGPFSHAEKEKNTEKGMAMRGIKPCNYFSVSSPLATQVNKFQCLTRKRGLKELSLSDLFNVANSPFSHFLFPFFC